MEIGGFKIIPLKAGTFKLDGGAMFGIIPKPLWEKSNPPDESNRVTLATNLLLLIGKEKKILIDTGMGNKWNQKMKDIYDIRQDEYSLELSLTKAGVQSDEITDVILTHLHFDHSGGATRISNGEIIPTFSRARCYVQKRNFEWALNPTERDRGSYLQENFLPLKDKGRLILVEDNYKYDENIEAIILNGHTFGQQIIKISDDLNTLLYCGDLLPFTSHVRLPYIMSYDLQPLVTLAEKKSILEKAAQENWKLFFEHDPYSFCYDIIKTEKGYSLHQNYEF